MTQVNRLDGGLIDRNTPLSFTFDGVPPTSDLFVILLKSSEILTGLTELPFVHTSFGKP